MVKHIEFDSVDWGKEYEGTTWVEFHQKWQSNDDNLGSRDYFVTIGEVLLMATGYTFPTGVEDGFQVELANGVTYEFKAEFQRWDVVKGTGNSVWITDELPDEQYTSNGDLWFDNTENTMQLFLYHEESDAWLPVAPPTTLEDKGSGG